MPNGKTHVKISLITGLTSITAATMMFNSIEIAAASLGGVLWATAITPDLDVDNGNITTAMIRSRLGRQVAWTYGIATWPYAKLAKHRGASHTPAFGTFWRIIYFYALIAILMSAWRLIVGGANAFGSFEDVLPLLWVFDDRHLMFLMGVAFAQACIIDLAHIIADRVSTALKKAHRRSTRRAPSRLHPAHTRGHHGPKVIGK